MQNPDVCILIPRVDDFGVSPGTNDAIIDTIDAGFIRNVGVMAPGPFLEHRLEDLLERQSRICLGVHATLHSEWANVRWGPVLPASEVPSLVEDDGTFHRHPRMLEKEGALAEAEAETQGQIDKLRGLGLEPQYLDCHMVFTWVRGMAEIVEKLCRRNKLAYANAPDFETLPLSLHAGAPDLILPRLEAITAHRTGPLVWVFHPAYRDAVSAQFYPDSATPSRDVSRQRAIEAECLTDAGLCKALQAASFIQLATYCDGA